MNTSLEAYAGLDQDERRSRMDAILEAISQAPLTARQVAARLGLDEHEATRRCSDLVTQGYAEKGEKVVNEETGNRAHLLTPSRGGLEYLRTGRPPKAPVKRGDLVKAVVEAARDRVDHGVPGVLEEALDALDRHDEGKPQYFVPASYRDPRREALAKEGVWLRRDGATVAFDEMTIHHLLGAVRWMRRHGALDAHPALAAVLEEVHRRSHILPPLSSSRSAP